MGIGIKTWFLSQEVFDLLQWSFLVMNMTAPPQVLSISWGSGESSYRPDHMVAASDEFGKMGLQGISIFTARSAALMSLWSSVLCGGAQDCSTTKPMCESAE